MKSVCNLRCHEGTTLASFHSVGTVPDESERLNSSDNGSAKLLLAKLSSIGDLYLLISFKNVLTSSALVVISHNVISEGEWLHKVLLKSVVSTVKLL